MFLSSCIYPPSVNIWLVQAGQVSSLRPCIHLYTNPTLIRITHWIRQLLMYSVLLASGSLILSCSHDHTRSNTKELDEIITAYYSSVAEEACKTFTYTLWYPSSIIVWLVSQFWYRGSGRIFGTITHLLTMDTMHFFIYQFINIMQITHWTCRIVGPSWPGTYPLHCLPFEN